MPEHSNLAEPTDLAEFRAFAAALGQDPLHVQGAGGNVSLKHNGAMWVKASAAWLEEAVARNIFPVIDYVQAVTQLEEETEPIYRRLDNDPSLRPSIETSLHIALPHRIVAHVHAVAVIALAVRLDVVMLCEEKLEGLSSVFVPYARPGWPLTQALRAVQKSDAVPNVYILGNHGLIVGGETVAEVKALLADVAARLEMPVRQAPIADVRFLVDAQGSKWRLPQSAAVHGLVTDELSHDYATGGSLYPDHVVFLGRGCRSVSGHQIDSIDPLRNPMILVERKGVLLANGLSPAGEAMAECLAAVVARIPPWSRLNYLTSRDESELLNWDAEKYRQTAT